MSPSRAQERKILVQKRESRGEGSLCSRIFGVGRESV